MNLTRILACVALLVVAGCVETAGTRVSIDTNSGEASVLEASSRLAGRLRVARVTYDDVDGYRKATVTLESKIHRRQDLQARMVWMDAAGAELDPDGKPFRAIVLDGLDVVMFTGVAPNPKGVKARLQVRETDTAE